MLPASKHLLLFFTQAKQAGEKMVRWQPANPGRRSTPDPLHSQLLRRGLGDNYLTVVLLENALDPEAFTTKQRVWEPRAPSPRGGGRPCQGEGSAWPWTPPALPCTSAVPTGKVSPASCPGPGVMGHLECPPPHHPTSGAKAFASLRIVLCAASTNPSIAKATIGQAHVHCA